MFLEEKDYAMISSDALQIFQQANAEKRETAEGMAIEEASSYLRSRYDTEKIFAATGTDRNKAVVMYVCDITLYHLVSWLPGKMGREVRKERYERAITWLEEVQKGNAVPNLPTLIGEDGVTDANNPVKWGSGKQNTYIW